MEVWTWILIAMVLVATGLFLWWLIVSISKPGCNTCNDDEPNDKTPMVINDNRSSFADLYKDFYLGLSSFSVNGGDNKEPLNVIVTNLSSFVCPSKYDNLKLMYDQNVSLLTEPLQDLSGEDAIKRRGQLDEMARDMAELYSNCISVDVSGLNNFFKLFNNLMLVKINAKDDIIKGKLDTNILALLEKLNFT
jgi:hypothetical protein